MAIIRNENDIRDGLAALVRIDPRLKPVIETVGTVPLRSMDPGFSGLAFIIVSQMVSKASAAAIWRRICAAGPVTPECYLQLADETIADFGLSRAKASTLRHLAESVSDGRIDLNQLAKLEPEAAMAQLVALPGIGPWSAEVYLMFCGGHADIFPSGDVALQSSIRNAFQLEVRPSAREVASIAVAWRPWRSVAARLFWAHYSENLRKDVERSTLQLM